MADTVSVSNELPNQSGSERSEPFTTRLIPLDRDDDPLVLPYSPRGHERSATPNWSERGAVGAEVDQLDWDNSAPDEVSFDFRVQAGPEQAMSASDLLTVIRQLGAWATEPTRRTGEPTRVVLEQGAGSASGVLDAVDATVTDKTPDGLPRIAELSVTIREQ